MERDRRNYLRFRNLHAKLAFAGALALTLAVGSFVGCADEPTGPEAQTGLTQSTRNVSSQQPQPVPVNPSPEDQVELIERILAGGDITEDDVPLVEYFNTQYLQPLSPASQAAVNAFTQETWNLQILTYEYEDRWDELATPLTPEYQAFVDEITPLFDFTVQGKDGGATIIAGAALVGGAIGCVGKAEACMDDSIDNAVACWNQECPAGKAVDHDCCHEEGKEDISNCAWTCGFNGPDPEYNSNCCKPKKTRVQQWESQSSNF